MLESCYVWMRFYEQLEDMPNLRPKTTIEINETPSTSTQQPQADDDTKDQEEKKLRRNYCRSLICLTQRLTFVLDQIESWLLSSHERRANMVVEMLPRAVHLLNTIGAWVKQAKVAAYQQQASTSTRTCEQDTY